MSRIILLIITLAALALAFYIEMRADAREKRAKREAAENGKRVADKITEANEIKENANTGNFDDDFSCMAGKLHDYAKK